MNLISGDFLSPILTNNIGSIIALALAFHIAVFMFIFYKMAYPGEGKADFKKNL
jgi:hypothetical protein